MATPPTVKPRTTPQSPPSAGPDVNILPPNNVPPPPVTPTPAPQPSPLGPNGQSGTTQVPVPLLPQFSMSSTEIVISAVLVMAWAGLLIVVKRLMTQSLVSQFADLGRSRAAGTTLYLFLLVLGATVIFCALGNFWQVLVIIIPAALLNLILLVLFLFSLTSARASRQRR